jgi:hypothetical protein
MFGLVPVLQRNALALGFIPESVKQFMAHPAGPFTSKSTSLTLIFVVFFWAPTFKWMITISNIGDLEKPAHLISTNQ